MEIEGITVRGRRQERVRGRAVTKRVIIRYVCLHHMRCGPQLGRVSELVSLHPWQRQKTSCGSLEGILCSLNFRHPPFFSGPSIERAGCLLKSRPYRRLSPPQLETRVLTQVSNLTQLPLAGLGRYSCTVAGVFSEAPAFLPLTGRDASLDSA